MGKRKGVVKAPVVEVEDAASEHGIVEEPSTDVRPCERLRGSCALAKSSTAITTSSARSKRSNVPWTKEVLETATTLYEEKGTWGKVVMPFNKLAKTRGWRSDCTENSICKAVAKRQRANSECPTAAAKTGGHNECGGVEDATKDRDISKPSWRLDKSSGAREKFSSRRAPRGETNSGAAWPLPGKALDAVVDLYEQFGDWESVVALFNELAETRGWRTELTATSISLAVHKNISRYPVQWPAEAIQAANELYDELECWESVVAPFSKLAQASGWGRVNTAAMIHGAVCCALDSSCGNDTGLWSTGLRPTEAVGAATELCEKLGTWPEVVGPFNKLAEARGRRSTAPASPRASLHWAARSRGPGMIAIA